MRDDFSPANVSHHFAGTQSQFVRRLTPVPLAAGADPKLNATALRLIINTSGYSDENGWCWLTQEEHGQLAGRNRNTIAKAQASLTRLGYLLAGHNLYDPARHRKRQTVYRVTDPTTTDASHHS